MARCPADVFHTTPAPPPDDNEDIFNDPAIDKTLAAAKEVFAEI